MTPPLRHQRGRDSQVSPGSKAGYVLQFSSLQSTHVSFYLIDSACLCHTELNYEPSSTEGLLDVGAASAADEELAAATAFLTEDSNLNED